MTTERRQISRSRVYQGASVVFNGRQAVLDCTIRNRSETGALIRMADWITLPPVFDLELANRGESLRVRQCWRRGDLVGVAFLTEEERKAPKPPTDLAAARARRLAERAAA